LVTAVVHRENCGTFHYKHDAGCYLQIAVTTTMPNQHRGQVQMQVQLQPRKSHHPSQTKRAAPKLAFEHPP
jgi:hypothetical protein